MAEITDLAKEKMESRRREKEKKRGKRSVFVFAFPKNRRPLPQIG